MRQLTDLYRLNLERDIKPTEEEQRALAESQRLFLENQAKFQAANEEVASLSERQCWAHHSYALNVYPFRPNHLEIAVRQVPGTNQKGKITQIPPLHVSLRRYP